MFGIRNRANDSSRVPDIASKNAAVDSSYFSMPREMRVAASRSGMGPQYRDPNPPSVSAKGVDSPTQSNKTYVTSNKVNSSPVKIDKAW